MAHALAMEHVNVMLGLQRQTVRCVPLITMDTHNAIVCYILVYVVTCNFILTPLRLHERVQL